VPITALRELTHQGITENEAGKYFSLVSSL